MRTAFRKCRIVNANKYLTFGYNHNNRGRASDKAVLSAVGNCFPFEIMDKECFICCESATDRYTLVLGTTEFFEDMLICDDCIPDFQETEWISVHDTPDQITIEESRQDEAGE